MEAAASLTTLIVFTLQSTKFVYQAVDDIRDGPSIIRTLVDSSKGLESVLNRLLQLINLHGQSGQAHVWEPLRQRVSQCSTDMQEASGKLEILNPDNAKHRIDKAWKIVKLSMKEKFFARLDDRITHHLAELGLQLQIIHSHLDISRDERQNQHHDTCQASLHDMKAQLSLQTAAVDSHIFEKAQIAESSLNKITLNLESADRTRTELSRQAYESLHQSTNLIIGQLNENQKDLQQHAHIVSEQVTSRIEKVQEMSSGQSETIVDLLHQIHGYLRTQSQATSSMDAKSGTRAQGVEDDKDPEVGRHLSAAIDRLCLLTSNTVTAYHSDEAEDIIDDLEHVLNALGDHDAGNLSKHHINQKRKRRDDNGSLDMSHGVKKMHGMLTASHTLEVTKSNLGASVHNCRRKMKAMRSSTNVYNLTDCTTVVSINTGIRSETGLTPATGTESGLNVYDVLRGNLTILPKRSIKPTKISVSFVQQLTSLGFNSLNPRLSFHPIVPYNANIIKAVENGDMKWMLELLETGKASLHDCDREGRSLLYYAILGLQLTTCRFLVDHGADINSFEKSEAHVYLAPLVHVRSYRADQHRLRTRLAIQQCLLESGADPLLQYAINHQHLTVFDQILQVYPTNTVTLILKYGKEFIDLKTRDVYGRDHLLRMLLDFGPNCGPDSSIENDLSQNIRLLVAHGAEIRMRDMSGKSCLHILITDSNNNFGGLGTKMMVKALCVLVELDADIYAVDNDGYSVTEWANFLQHGSFWEEALELAGLNIKQVYAKDHNNGWKVSGDVFAPDRNHPRQKAGCSEASLDLAYEEALKRKRLTFSRFSNKKSKDECNEINNRSLNSEEEGNDVRTEDYDVQDSRCDLMSGSPNDSESDDDMGGVSVMDG